jgi:hypothetical protein
MPSTITRQAWDYRAGMSKECSEALRVLRNSGWAVAILKPEVVGHPMHRRSIEESMVMRGVNRAAELSHSNIHVRTRR